MPINTVTRTPHQRTIGPITSTATMDRIESTVLRTLNSIETSVIDKIETFSESHPRAIKTLEPAICSLIRFAHIYPTLSIVLAPIPLIITVMFSMVLTAMFLEYLALSNLTLGIIGLLVAITNTSFLLTSLFLGMTVPEKLVKKHLEQTVEINKLAETFLNLAPEFVAALNEWTKRESQEIGSQWGNARKSIINFYKSNNRKYLDLANYNLHSLPNIFDDPNFRNRLEWLFLQNNHLTRLPESIGNLQSLIFLNLADNSELADLPLAILQMTSLFLIAIANCNFSETVIARTREISTIYRGPRITDSIMSDETPSEPPASIEQSLKNFYRISGRNYNELTNLNSLPNLCTWLHKLNWVDQFSGKSQQAFVTKIIKYLERANEDTAFYEVFKATIWDATDSCGDRVALSVLNLGVAYKLSTLDLNNMHELYHLLTRGVLALDLLQNIARQKIPSLEKFDEIEVYLGYPVKLKEALNLPIDIESMLYFSSSSLLPQDLEDAKNSVLRSLSNEDMQIAFLKTQPKWIDALNMNYPEEMERIAEENPDLSEQSLINLTREIIQSFSS